MRDKTYILLTVGISLLVLTSAAGAQDEQWLQYHSEREAMRIVGDMMRSNLRLTSEKPQGVELPDFKAEEPFFTSWSTPMVAGGQLWIAVDRSTEKGRWDQLYIDSNVNGHLNDETAVTAYRTEQYYTYFGPVKIVFEGEDGPLTYHLNFMFRESGEISVMARQCLSDRMDNIAYLQSESMAWAEKRNAQEAKVDWRFTTKDARIKLKRLYPSIE